MDDLALPEHMVRWLSWSHHCTSRLVLPANPRSKTDLVVQGLYMAES